MSFDEAWIEPACRPLVEYKQRKTKGFYMFEKLRIKEHMEVANCKGQHVGTVDEVEGDVIKLTKSDSADDMHHFLSLDDVEKIDDNRIYLKEGARIPEGLGNKSVMEDA